MTTIAGLVDKTLRELLSGHRAQQNKLAIDINAADESLEFTYELGSITPGALLTVAFEDMYVWETAEGNKSATVERGYNGTAALAHSIGDVVNVNPVFSRAAALEAINEVIISLPGEGLFQVKTVDLTSSATAWTYNLGSVTDLLDVYDVHVDATGPANEWPTVDRWEVRRNQTLGEFASGFLLRLNEEVPPSRTMRVAYKAGFNAVADTSVDVELDSGCPTSFMGLLALGAQVRLMGVREAKRTFTEAQPDTRRATEVPVGSSSRSAATLLQLYNRRLGVERSRLDQQYPVRRR